MNKHNEDLSLGRVNAAIEQMTGSPWWAFVLLMIIMIVALCTGNGH
jgi:hypothetical protein